MRHSAATALLWATLAAPSIALIAGCGSEPEATQTATPQVQAPAGGQAKSSALQNQQPSKPARSPIQRPAAYEPKVAKVTLSEQHLAMCKVFAGDKMPEIRLPSAKGVETDLSSLYGEKLTVVFFWSGDRALARMQMADLGFDIARPYASQGVSVVGIAVNNSVEEVEKQMRAAEVSYPVLFDRDGKAFDKVGQDKLPRTFLLDSSGRIIWFDIEYSRATRRELLEAIRVRLEASSQPT